MEQGRESKQEILLVPVGKVLVDILSEMAVALRKIYKYHVRIGRSEEPAMDTYSDERRQYDAAKLMPLLSVRKRDHLAAVLGVVDADMFVGEKNFVFGAQHSGKLALVALTRLREEFYKKPPKSELFMRRAVTAGIEQVGLALGLPPCASKRCVLAPANALWRLDEKPQQLCGTCQTRLAAMLAPAPRPAPAPPAEEAVRADEDEPQGPENEPQVVPEAGSSSMESKLEDETEIASALLEPEAPLAAEEAALHTCEGNPEEFTENS